MGRWGVVQVWWLALALVLGMLGPACTGSQVSDDEIAAAAKKRPVAEEEEDVGLFGKVDPATPHLELAMVDVGQGDGMVLRTPSGRIIVLDTGKGGRAMTDWMRGAGITSVDMMLLTHPHADHIGGADDIIKNFEVKRVLDSFSPHDSTMYAKLLEQIEAKEIPLYRATRGRRISFGDGIEGVLLGPPDPPIAGTRSDPNSNSIVLFLTYGSITFLFTGDAEHETEEMLLQGVEELPMQATVLKVAHHGSRYATDETFLAQVKPQVALISVGEGNTYGHPAPETLERLGKVTPHIFRTDQSGTIRLLTDGRRLNLLPERGASLP